MNPIPLDEGVAEALAKAHHQQGHCPVAGPQRHRPCSTDISSCLDRPDLGPGAPTAPAGRALVGQDPDRNLLRDSLEAEGSSALEVRTVLLHRLGEHARGLGTSVSEANWMMM